MPVSAVRATTEVQKSFNMSYSVFDQNERCTRVAHHLMAANVTDGRRMTTRGRIDADRSTEMQSILVEAGRAK
jgi:hypothetical protein